MSSAEIELHDTLAGLNRTWREGRPDAMREYLHPEVSMVLPGFTGTLAGRDALVASFAEFCSNARVIEYTESQEEIRIIGNVAVVSFRFDMLYERATYRERSTGRDIWVFGRVGGTWIAHWRMMLDVEGKREAIK